MSDSFIKVFAPVNIAWIKYMGKNSGKPTNSSLSLTLATLGTHTTMRVDGSSPTLCFEWHPEGYIPPVMGQKKVEDFLRHEAIWSELLTQFGFHYKVPKAKMVIQTHNNVPAGTGIATSASAFAALTLAWSAILAGERSAEWMEKYKSGDPKMRRAMASVSAQGSGSSCRSFDGPWVEWNPQSGITVIDGGAQEWVDFILLVESGHKEVSSSEAHVRVKTSPYFGERVARAEKRLVELKSLLKNKPMVFPPIQKLVLEEALDMHHLFETAEPSFRYRTDLSEEIVEKVGLEKFNGVVTLDAGANVHLFVPEKNASECEEWIKATYPQLRYLKDIAGYGAFYGDHP